MRLLLLLIIVVPIISFASMPIRQEDSGCEFLKIKNGCVLLCYRGYIGMTSQIVQDDNCYINK